MVTFSRRIGVSLALVCLAGFIQQAAWAAQEFTASESCDAYASTKKLTNPGDIKLEAGKAYPFLRTNRPHNPEWASVKIEAADPPDRWVKIKCGKIENASGNSGNAGKDHGKDDGKPQDGGAACGVAGQADSYVFAVSWQPAFCESKADKPECKINDPKVYQATHFTLHGLWPNKTSCGTNYGYCGEVKAKPAGDFCDYPQVPLSAPVRGKLAEVMPSVGAGSCLERHEWHKHGACQNASSDQYYEEAVNLTHQFNDSGVAQFMGKHIGKQVKLAEFHAVLDQSLGAGASQHAKLGCKDGLLVDIYLSLPADLKPGAELKTLLAQAPQAPADNTCKNGFRVDAIGQ